jgi:hypothetical protein
VRQIDLVPAERHQFRDAQTVAKGDQDQGRVAQAMAALGGRGGADGRDLCVREDALSVR